MTHDLVSGDFALKNEWTKETKYITVKLSLDSGDS